MATGRCAGCQATGAVPRMRAHVADCPDWQALPPGLALDPAAEYVRWKSGDEGTERLQRRADAVEQTEVRRAEGRERWKTPEDILA